MALECPRCGLLSPDGAARCDCGYDFDRNTIESSYLMAHVLRKHGGEVRLIEETSRARIRTGMLLLAVAVMVCVLSIAYDGHAAFWGGGVLVGSLLLLRGFRQRRQKSLDTAARKDLMRRS